MAEFPVGGTFGQGRYTIVEALRGEPDRGMYRAVETGGNTRYVVTLGPPQTRDVAELQAQLALAVPRIAPLAYIGPLEPHTEAAYDGMLELEPAGVPASALKLPLLSDTAAVLACAIGRVIAGAHEARTPLGGLRPELVYVKSTSAALLTRIAPRAERFWLTGAKRSYGVAACFENFYFSPEQLARPYDPPTPASDVFALGTMLAHWLTGEHPFEGEGPAQGMSIVLGRRRASRLPEPFAAIVDGALSADPANRTPLPALLEQLGR